MITADYWVITADYREITADYWVNYCRLLNDYCQLLSKFLRLYSNLCRLLTAPVPFLCKPGAICVVNVAVYINHVSLSNVRKPFCVSKTKNELCFETYKGSQLTLKEIGEVSVVAAVLPKLEVPVCFMF